MESFVEGVQLIDVIESREQFTLNPKDGSKRSIFPEWADDKGRKYSIPKVTMTDRNSSLTSSIMRERYKRGNPMRSAKT